MAKKQKVVVVGAGPVGSLAALYAANRGDNVEIYELRSGESFLIFLELHTTHCVTVAPTRLAAPPGVSKTWPGVVLMP